MREIKFRGKRTDNGEWIFGCLVNNLWLYNIDGISKGGIANGTKVCEIITGDYEGDCWEDIIDEEKTIVEVTPESVGQFTGLKDKNGKDAYEKDYDEDGNMIDWCDDCCGYQFFQIDIPTKDIICCHNCEGDFMLQDHITDFEIIGNIYENPELINL